MQFEKTKLKLKNEVKKLRTRTIFPLCPKRFRGGNIAKHGIKTDAKHVVKKKTKKMINLRDLVYRNSAVGVIEEGVAFYLSCSKKRDFQTFTILFKDKQIGDIPLQLKSNLIQNYISRRSRVDGKWSTSEFSSAAQLKTTKEVKVLVLITNNEFLMSLNGIHFGAYRHRCSILQIKRIEIRGDLENITVIKKVIPNYPIFKKFPPLINVCIVTHKTSTLSISNEKSMVCNKSDSNENLPVPYYCRLPGILLKGHKISIEGRLKILPQYFFINLQTGTKIWPDPIILLHFNVRFILQSRPIIYKNSCLNGKWGHSEYMKVPRELAPGRNFNLTFFAAEKSYEIYLNEVLISKFDYRNTSSIIDTVQIRGDIFLQGVTLIREKKFFKKVILNNIRNIY